MTLRAVCCFNLAFNIFKERNQRKLTSLTQYFLPGFHRFSLWKPDIAITILIRTTPQKGRKDNNISIPQNLFPFIFEGAFWERTASPHHSSKRKAKVDRLWIEFILEFTMYLFDIQLIILNMILCYICRKRVEAGPDHITILPVHFSVARTGCRFGQVDDPCTGRRIFSGKRFHALWFNVRPHWYPDGRSSAVFPKWVSVFIGTRKPETGVRTIYADRFPERLWQPGYFRL